jgi:O-antigen biosynthesis protein
MKMPVPKISAFVICYNRADVLGSCLQALRFADELIVVDKSSTDACRTIAEACADHVLTVPWTPTVEETRSLALSLCQHEWILFMDDDEILSVAAEPYIRAELAKPQADIYEFALRHYILGRHDERAYYWPEHHVRLFRRGAVTFSGTVHAGITRHSDRLVRFPVNDGVSIHHLSNANVTGWIEKANRYTSNPKRAGIKAGPNGLAAFAHQRIEHWMERTGDDAPSGYPAAVAVLRAIYDMIDAVKSWEEESGEDGAVLLRQASKSLDDARRHYRLPAIAD